MSDNFEPDFDVIPEQSNNCMVVKPRSRRGTDWAHVALSGFRTASVGGYVVPWHAWATVLERARSDGLRMKS